MIVKEVSFDRSKLISGINTIADAVKSTLGARGQTVLIESEHHIGGLTVTKDGVTVAKSINLLDPTENLAVMMMRQAAETTATMAGDGTTTAIVLAQALIHCASEVIGKQQNKTTVLREIRSASLEVIDKLRKCSKSVSGKTLHNVATISANNDTDLGDIIAKAYDTVGQSGIVTVENSSGSDTYCEVVGGMRVNRGYGSKHFVTDTRKDECVLDNPYVLLTDQEIPTINSIEQILGPITKGNKSLLIIGNVSPAVMTTLNVNKVKGNIKVCVIQPPQFGWKSHELMKDLAVATGGRYMSEDTGDDTQLIQMADLGRVEKAIISQATTVLMKTHDEESKASVDSLVSGLWEDHDSSERQDEKDFCKERMGVLTGGIGVIYVGANSDIEQKEKRDRVDDAVCATRAALEEGILPGGGVALRDCSTQFAMDDDMSDEAITARGILGTAMRAPFAQILENGGMDCDVTKSGHGMDVKTGNQGDMMKMGIIDPTKVTISALENAVSVATTILSTNAIITNIRDYESNR
tara:strand:+ start:571 stop:2142 length:1572 start_codon:yes stop_codon:yes gene_type:complete